MDKAARSLLVAMGMAVMAVFGLKDAGAGSAAGTWSGSLEREAPIDRQTHAHLETADFALG